MGHSRYVNRCIILETDSREVLFILNGSSLALVNFGLVRALKELLSREWCVQLQYIKRGSNGVTDKLATMSRGLSIGSSLFPSPPLAILLVRKDMSQSSMEVDNYVHLGKDLGG
ncbi:hypothetical protein V6N13_006225 [Hibiscus sabdariffa]|uniref:RNase H type-1 domain-containing protein n=1 Tax=Hibiscus sabdariffa TaxID=183260 RepID=A0ABR2ENJ7_9ROSI